MSSVQVLFTICLAVRWCTAGPVILDGALQDLRELNLTQAKLVADNASLKCSLTPNLCDWQLHLYEGHSFSVPLVPAVETKAPAQESFELTPPGTGPQLFIVAEVEPKSRREIRRKRKLAHRTSFNYLSKHKFILLVFQQGPQ